MKYSDTTTKAGIIQTIENLTDLGDAYISGDTTRLKEFNSKINRTQHKVWHIIHTSTGNWSYDDGNQTDLPVAKTDLVSGQSTYTLPSEALTVERIAVKDESDVWTRLTPITDEKIPTAIEEFRDEDGSPRYYKLKGNVITLYPAADYSQSASLEVFYDRDSVDFAYDATTASPGFASPYHEILPIGASIEWYKVKQPQSPTLGILIQDYAKLEVSIRDFYANRFKDYTPRISRQYQTYK